MFVWGLMSYENYHLSVHRADIDHGDHILDYRVAISNKRYQSTQVDISVEGLPESAYTLSDHVAKFSEAKRVDLNLHIDAKLEPGIHGIIIKAKSKDGWQDSYRIQHFVARSKI
jgi:uncharacterized membrane protein